MYALLHIISLISSLHPIFDALFIIQFTFFFFRKLMYAWGMCAILDVFNLRIDGVFLAWYYTLPSVLYRRMCVWCLCVCDACVCVMLVCVWYVFMCVCEECVWNIKRQLRVLALTFHHVLRQGLVVFHHCTCLASWPTGFQVFSSL